MNAKESILAPHSLPVPIQKVPSVAPVIRDIPAMAKFVLISMNAPEISTYVVKTRLAQTQKEAIHALVMLATVAMDDNARTSTSA